MSPPTSPSNWLHELKSVLGKLWEMYVVSQMKNAASELASDYQKDEDLQAFSNLDGEDILDDAGNIQYAS